MIRQRSAAWLFLSPLLTASQAVAVDLAVPPGYEAVRITDDQGFSLHARMNNRGQIVWEAEENGDREIYLYTDGHVLRLTNNNVGDALPDINDNGDIVWESGTEYVRDILMLRNGQIVRLTNGESEARNPCINNLGHVAWSQGRFPRHVYFYDGQAVRRISEHGDNQSVGLNDRDELTWTDYGAEDDPEDRERVVMLYSNGVINQISPAGASATTIGAINDRGEVLWTEHFPNCRNYLWLWRNGVNELLTAHGAGGAFNDRGDIGFWRFDHYGGSNSYQGWLLRDGQFFELTNDTSVPWNWIDDVNDRGEFVFFTGRVDHTQLIYARRALDRRPNHGAMTDHGSTNPAGVRKPQGGSAP